MTTLLCFQYQTNWMFPTQLLLQVESGCQCLQLYSELQTDHRLVLNWLLVLVTVTPGC